MQLLLAGPPAFTPPYDHALAAALARAGMDVELVTSRFRFGDTDAPTGYRREVERRDDGRIACARDARGSSGRRSLEPRTRRDGAIRIVLEP